MSLALTYVLTVCVCVEVNSRETRKKKSVRTVNRTRRDSMSTFFSTSCTNLSICDSFNVFTLTMLFFEEFDRKDSIYSFTLSLSLSNRFKNLNSRLSELSEPTTHSICNTYFFHFLFCFLTTICIDLKRNISRVEPYLFRQ